MKKLILPLLLLVAFGMLVAVESDPSEVVGYVKYPCVAELNHIALPMEQGYTMASEFAADYPDAMDAMNYWDAVSQSWASAINLGGGEWDGDFPVGPGSVLLVYAYSAFDAFSIGNLPATNASYSLLEELNDIMIPLNRADITMASQAGEEIGVLDAMNYWDATSQSWASAINLGGGEWDGDFPVTIGFPLQVYALSATTWPVRAATTTFGTRSK